MFHYRLAAKLGVADVDGMIDAMPPGQLLEWQAVALLDGWYCGWAKQAELLAAMHNQTNRLVLAQAAEPRKVENQLEWKSGSEIAEGLTAFGQRPKRKNMMTPEQLRETLERRNK